MNKVSDYGPYFNLIYATKDDHIGYVAIGALPIRASPDDGNYIKDGTSSANDWRGLVKGKDKLNLQNPKKGYIVSANNKAATSKYLGGILDMTMFTGRATRIEHLI